MTYRRDTDGVTKEFTTELCHRKNDDVSLTKSWDMIRKFRVCFYLRSYKTKDGKSPILVRLYLNGERMILGSAGFNVEEKQWDKSKGRVKGRTSEANKVNEALEL